MKHSSAEVFFHQAKRCFDKALRNTDIISHYISINGFCVELQFAGRAIEARLWQALAHLEIAPSKTTDHQIQIWDSYSGKTPMFPMTWSTEDIQVMGLVKHFNNDKFETAFMHEPIGFNMISHIDNNSIFWVQDYRNIPAYISAAPLRILFHWWLRQHKLFLTHGAAVGTNDGAALLVGKGGSGKSTSATSCLHHSLLYLGDDYCLTQLEPSPEVYSLYNSNKLTYESWKRWPHLRQFFSGMSRLDEEKIIHFLHPEKEERLRHNLPLKAIIVPMISRKSSPCFSRLPANKALQAIAPSSIFQLPGTGVKEFQYYSSLVQKVPSYQLYLNGDITTIPQKISSIIHDASLN